jgi:hypothetical protein
MKAALMKCSEEAYKPLQLLSVDTAGKSRDVLKHWFYSILHVPAWRLQEWCAANIVGQDTFDLSFRALEV